MTPNKILVANIGSTSFKFRLIEMPSERVLAKGGVERIGSAESPWKAQIGNEPEQSGTTALPDHGAAIALGEKLLGESHDHFRKPASSARPEGEPIS